MWAEGGIIKEIKPRLCGYNLQYNLEFTCATSNQIRFRNFPIKLCPLFERLPLENFPVNQFKGQTCGEHFTI